MTSFFQKNQGKIGAALALLVGVVLVSTLTGMGRSSCQQDGGQLVSSKERVRKGGTKFSIIEEPISSSLVEDERVSSDDAMYEESIVEKKNVPSGPISFIHTPSTFVDTIKSCEHDDTCRLTFHHVFKTGGTTIEKNLAPLWNQTHVNSCCDDKRLRYVRRNRDDLCQAKFDSHQVNSIAFFSIVDECVNRFPKKKSRPRPRVVLLTTFREPIQMTISQIHQMCNRHPHKRTQRVLDACTVCNYDNYTDVWDDMMDTVTSQLESALEISRLRTTVDLPNDTRVLTLENSDITDFFARYKPDYKLFSTNKAKDDVCYFKATSAMTKKLAKAQRVYRQLVANADYQ